VGGRKDPRALTGVETNGFITQNFVRTQ